MGEIRVKTVDGLEELAQLVVSEGGALKKLPLKEMDWRRVTERVKVLGSLDVADRYFYNEGRDFAISHVSFFSSPMKGYHEGWDARWKRGGSLRAGDCFAPTLEQLLRMLWKRHGILAVIVDRDGGILAGPS
jgi:hypothetical protein